MQTWSEKQSMGLSIKNKCGCCFGCLCRESMVFSGRSSWLLMFRDALLYDPPAQRLPQKNLSLLTLTPVYALQTHVTYLLQIVIMNEVSLCKAYERD
jgi:hypothetical protein